MDAFLTLFGCWARLGGGVEKDWYTTYFCNFSPLCSSKFEVLETFFDIVTTQNDHARYVKHILGNIDVFSTLCLVVYGCTCAHSLIGGGGILPWHGT